MTTWLRIAFDQSLAHVVSRELAPGLIADMLERGHPIENFEAKYGIEHARALGGNPRVVTEWSLDIGGPCHIAEPNEVLDVDGLRISVPCHSHDVVQRVVEDKSPIRRFAEGAWYYKFKFWLHATVMSVEQRDELLRQLEDRQQTARERALVFQASICRGAKRGARVTDIEKARAAREARALVEGAAEARAIATQLVEALPGSLQALEFAIQTQALMIATIAICDACGTSRDMAVELFANLATKLTYPVAVIE